MKELASGTDRQIFGKLGSVSLNDIIQLLGMSKRTATLELRRGEERGRVYFRDGQVVHASAGPYEGEESFIELLGWADADFSVEEGIHSLPKISITKSTEALLLSTMTALDEVGRVTGRPPIQVAPQIIEPPERSTPPKRRLPPRPKPRPARSGSRRALVLVGLSAVAIASLSWWMLTPATEPVSWMPAPWVELPSVESPPQTTPALLVPDAWSIASAIWARPGPSASAPAVTAPTAPTTAAAPEPAPTPPPASAPAAAEAYLTVVVEPWARVALNGEDVGQTPLAKLELTAGTHRLTLSNDHIVGVIRDDVVIQAGETVTKRYSFNDTGYLRLVVTPWADVSVDGRAIGQTPLGRLAVPAGVHVVRFSHPELGTAERRVRIVSGETTLLKVELP